MTTAGEFTVPTKQYDWRCPGCGTPWARSVDRTHAVRLAGEHQARPFDQEGWATCCNNRFRWADQTQEWLVL